MNEEFTALVLFTPNKLGGRLSYEIGGAIYKMAPAVATPASKNHQAQLFLFFQKFYMQMTMPSLLESVRTFFSLDSCVCN